jgi:hypothetical protein
MKHLLLFIAVAAVMLYASRGTVIFAPYTYDEPDYMYAVSLGWSANMLDSPTLSFPEFLKLGLDRNHKQGESTDLSELIRDRGDVVFYRHWHGPLYSGWLALAHAFADREMAVREWNFAFPIAAGALIYFGALWLLPPTAGFSAAILGCIFYLWSYPVIRSTELAPHQLFALCVTAALLLMARMFKDENSPRRWWYAAVAVSAIAFCVLEVAFALIFTLLICSCLLRERLQPDWAFAAKSVGLFVGSVFVLWPGALLKLSFIKAYLFMAYLALLRHDAWGAGVSLGETWRIRLIQSPLPWVLAAVGAVYFLRHRRETRVLLPVAIFTIAMAAALARVNTSMARYTLPMWPGVVLFGAFATGVMLANWKPVARAAAVAGLCVVMLATSWPDLRRNLPRRDTRSEAMFALVREQGLAAKNVLVPHEDLPMLHYYFAGSRFKSYYDESTIPERERNGGIDGAIDRSNPPRWFPYSSAGASH